MSRPDALEDLVREFHDTFGFHVADEPSIPPDRIRIERARLIAEEAGEVVAELLAGHPDAARLFGELVSAFARRATPAEWPNVVRLAGELADLEYVIAGAAVNWGIPLAACVREVHRANMAKVGPDGRPVADANGKAVKPAGWQPPDISSIIDMAGQPSAATVRRAAMWMLPDEPGPEVRVVRDALDFVWHRDGTSPGDRWRCFSDDLPVDMYWPDLLTRGPLVDISDTQEVRDA